MLKMTTRNQYIQDSSSYHIANTPIWKDYTMLMAIAIGISAHAIGIFGISFTEGKSPSSVAQEVARSMIDNKEENKDANFIADGGQKGSGTEEEKQRLESTQISPLTDEELQDTQDIINQEKQIKQRKYEQSYLRTTLSWRDVDKENDNNDENKENELEEQEARIRQEIATLEAQLSQQERVLSSKTQITTIDSNSTTHNVSAVFLENFRQHVERIANQYYPSQALSRGITGDVRLMVIIKPDGNVKAIRLLESSGSPLLDEAAKQSVRKSAPYGKFTPEMKDIVELRIIRTWRYSGDISVNY